MLWMLMKDVDAVDVDEGCWWRMLMKDVDAVDIDEGCWCCGCWWRMLMLWSRNFKSCLWTQSLRLFFLWCCVGQLSALPFCLYFIYPSILTVNVFINVFRCSSVVLPELPLSCNFHFSDFFSPQLTRRR